MKNKPIGLIIFIASCFIFCLWIISIQYVKINTINETLEKTEIKKNIKCYNYGELDMVIIDYDTGLVVQIENYERPYGREYVVVINGYEAMTYIGDDKPARQMLVNIYNDMR